MSHFSFEREMEDEFTGDRKKGPEEPELPQRRKRMTDITDDWTNDEPIIVGMTYRRSSEISELFGALAKAQASYGALEKTKTASVKGQSRRGTEYEYSYTYATLADTIEATKALHENGISVMQFPVVLGEKIAITTLLGHQSGQWIESTIEAAPAEWTVQSMGSSITYLRRYARQSITGIAPEDDDGAAGVRSPTQYTKQASRPFPAVGANATSAAPRHSTNTQGGNGRSPAPPPPGPPIDPETGEILAPHAIPVPDRQDKWLVVGRQFIEAIRAAQTPAELDAWQRENASTLASISMHEAKAFGFIKGALAKEAARLGPTDDLVTEDDASFVLDRTRMGET
jgi:hypothetical protein